MPEIAEVALMADSIRRILTQSNSPSQIESISVNGGRYYPDKLDNLTQFNQACPLQVVNVQTKGKFCWLELRSSSQEANDINWIIGLTFGMTGTILYQAPPGQIPHIEFKVDQHTSFYYHDTRRFGRLVLTTDRQWLQKKLDSLGPDMLTGPPISDQEFIQALRRFNRSNICSALMNQKAVSGIGNYLKAEVLYKTGISPFNRVRDIPDQVLASLHRIIRQTTQQAYQAQGASLYTYRGADRAKGHFQAFLQVYGKSEDPEGHPVLTAKTPDGRTTHYVPAKQKIYVRPR